MRIFNTLLFSVLFVSSAQITVFAQNGNPANAGARGLAMGDASVTFRDINSIFSNQAGLGFLTELSGTVFGESRFLVPEIKLIHGGFAYPTPSGTFGINLSYYGYDQYNEQKIGIAYARKLLDELTIGAQIDYISTRIQEYGNSSNFTFELGVQAQLLEVFRIGAHVFSPVRIKITEEDIIPTIIKIGAAWEGSEKVLISAEVEKDIDFPVSFKAGLEYLVVDQLALRAGVSTEPVQNSFGIGLYLGGLRIDLATAYHQVLGFTPSIGISFVNQKKEANEVPSN